MLKNVLFLLKNCQTLEALPPHSLVSCGWGPPPDPHISYLALSIFSLRLPTRTDSFGIA